MGNVTPKKRKGSLGLRYISRRVPAQSGKKIAEPKFRGVERSFVGKSEYRSDRLPDTKPVPPSYLGR